MRKRVLGTDPCFYSYIRLFKKSSLSRMSDSFITSFNLVFLVYTAPFDGISINTEIVAASKPAAFKQKNK